MGNGNEICVLELSKEMRTEDSQLCRGIKTKRMFSLRYMQKIRKKNKEYVCKMMSKMELTTWSESKG